MNLPGTMLTRLILILGLALSFGTQADALDDILDRGKIRVGVSLFARPPGDGDLVVRPLRDPLVKAAPVDLLIRRHA